MATKPGQLDGLDVTEPAMRLECVHERIHEAILGQRVEAILPPDPEDTNGLGLAIDPWLDPADEPVPEPDRQHVIPPATLRSRDVDLPDVVEPEQRAQQLAVPDERIERGQERDARWPSIRWSAAGDLPLGLVEEWQLLADDEPVRP